MDTSLSHSSTYFDSPPGHSFALRDNAGLAPVPTKDMTLLTDWFSGRVALRRADAHRLLERVVDSGQMAQYRAEFVAAIKALAAGPGNWSAMGYRLLPDH